MSNMNLFETELYQINPAKNRKEPVVWIKQLRLVENLTPEGKVIQDIQFRRGLNIICTERAQLDDRRVVGHSVGKTLLLRLIRYCLGEHVFSTQVVRSAITAVLEHAYVLAEVRISGRQWMVARPIGREIGRRSSWALEGNDINQLLAGPNDALKYSDFTSALEVATTKPFLNVILPHVERPASWLDLLAWLSRDQECRFRHQSRWRDPESESRMAQLQVEDASLVMRMAMDLLGDEEKVLQRTHARLLSDKKTLVSRSTYLEQLLNSEGDGLRRILGINTDVHAGELFGSAAGAEAQEKTGQLRRLLAEREADKTVGDADKLRLECLTTVAQLQQQKNEANGKRDAESALLIQLEEADTQTYYASFSGLGEQWCRLFPTAADAKAKGCPGESLAVHKPGEKDPGQTKRIADGKIHIAALEGQIGRIQRELSIQVAEQNKAQLIYQKAFDNHVKAVGEIRERIGYWQEIEERAKSYVESWAELTQKRTELEALERAVQESNEKQRMSRALLESKRIELSHHFDFVLKKLISPDAGGEILLEARGIIPQPNGSIAASGQALSTSATVLGFDFACLIGYITGLGHLPGLLLHDSPREADMEDALYHRFFDIAAHLERIFREIEPSFQYIVATTTPPPDELDCEPFVRLRLDARKNDGLLLRRQLVVQ